MTEFDDKDLHYVSSIYDKDRFDTKKAIARFNEHTATETAMPRRWWVTAAAVAASVVVVFAAGAGIYSAVRHTEPEEARPETVVLNPDVSITHEFVYNDAPVEDVLQELSAYYHCTLSAGPSGKHLTATFPDDDIDFIVSLIEKALDIEITVER